MVKTDLTDMMLYRESRDVSDWRRLWRLADVYVHACMRMHVYVCVCMYVCMYVYVYVYVYACACACMCMGRRGTSHEPQGAMVM
jgi:hypothetical protein